MTHIAYIACQGDQAVSLTERSLSIAELWKCANEYSKHYSFTSVGFYWGLSRGWVEINQLDFQVWDSIYSVVLWKRRIWLQLVTSVHRYMVTFVTAVLDFPVTTTWPSLSPEPHSVLGYLNFLIPAHSQLQSGATMGKRVRPSVP
jgi:hypothetical protein